MNTTPTKSISLHFREGASDKVYQAAVEPKHDGYIVTFDYGRRGNTSEAHLLELFLTHFPTARSLLESGEALVEITGP